MWKNKDRSALTLALGRDDFSIENGFVIVDGEPLYDEDLRSRVAEALVADVDKRSAERRVQLDKRVQIITEHFIEAFRICDLIIAMGMQRFGGLLPEEITSRDPGLLLWGEWMRDMKKAIDASEPGAPPMMLPFPPLPSWLDLSSPAVAALCARIYLI